MSKSSRLRKLQLQSWAETHALEPRVQNPEDWPEHYRLDPVGFWPLYSGDCAPGFVGLYTVVNALDLLLANSTPLEPAERKWLLDLGWRFLMDRRPVWLWSSTRVGTMTRLADALSFALSRRRGRYIRCHEIRMALIEPTPANFERLVVAKQSVIMLLGYGHYSVLRGYTRESWLLFDCTGRRWMKRDGGDVRRRVPCQPKPAQAAIIVLSTA